MTFNPAQTPGRRDSLIKLLQDVELPVTTVLGSALEVALGDAESPLPIFVLAKQLSEESESMDSGMDSEPETPPVIVMTTTTTSETPHWAPGIFEAACQQHLQQRQPQQLPAMQMLAPKHELERHVSPVVFEPSGLEFGYGTGSDCGSMTPPTPGFGAQSPRAGGTAYEPRQMATPQERKLRKQASNRRAAQKFRHKKKMELSNAMAIIAQLEQQNAAMQGELAQIKAALR